MSVTESPAKTILSKFFKSIPNTPFHKGVPKERSAHDDYEDKQDEANVHVIIVAPFYFTGDALLQFSFIFLAPTTEKGDMMGE